MFVRVLFSCALVASLLVVGATPSVAREVRSGTKTCSAGQRVVIVSDGVGWVSHSFSKGPDTKTYVHQFGTPTTWRPRETYTWMQSVQWQVLAKDTDKWEGNIDNVDVLCLSISHRTPDEPYIYRHGYKTCPQGEYVWIETKYYGKFLHRWYQSSSDQYKNAWGGTFGQVNWAVTPTWKRSAFWRVFVYSSTQELLKNRVFCAAKSGGLHD